MKTLYFEGAGWSGADISKATVGNCRIRTAFHLKSGQAVYLELSACEVGKKSPARLQGYKYAGFVDHCFYITDDKPNDDCNKHRLAMERSYTFEYDHASILKLVNTMGGDFDAVEVLPDLSGYRVHASRGGYNFGDEFVPDREAIKRAQEVHAYFHELEKKQGKEYPNFSLWNDEADKTKLHLLRHFNGYNKHWTIDVSRDDWQNTVRETGPGRTNWCAWE